MITIGLLGGASGKELTEQIQKNGFKVALIAGKDGEPGVDIADYVLITDLRNSTTIADFFHDHNIKYLIIGTGHRFAFKLGEELERQGVQLNINIHASKLAKEKRVYKDYISKKGFLTPEYFSILEEDSIFDAGEIVEKVGLPCVVKATIDTINPQKVNSIHSLKTAIKSVLNSGSPAIVEQFIRGIDVTVFVSVANNKAKALPICYYSKAEDNHLKGFSADEYLKEHLSIENEEKVKHHCEELVLECGFEGLPRVDLMVLPNGKSYILEVNSVGVTGICERHAAYCKGTVLALREQGVDVAQIAIETAIRKFGLI